MKGKREVQKLSLDECGVLIMCVICMSAGGFFVPPMIIFPCKNRKNKLGDGCPPGAISQKMDGFSTTCSLSGSNILLALYI